MSQLNPQASAYEALFEPIKLGTTDVKNRVVMTSMHTGLEDAPWTLDRLAAYYAERAKGGVGMIITGGYAPNWRGALYPGGSTARYPFSLWGHRKVTRSAQQEGCKIIMQLLHAGRYGFHPFIVAPSAKKTRINRFTPKALTTAQVKQTVKDFAISARRAKEAGYDGVEIMGSEGYLINEFLAERVNQRDDQYGGSVENRQRFALEIVEAVREAAGEDFILLFRLSIIDLVEQGQTYDAIISLGQALEASGVDALTSGIGWHEARVPTIVTSVPRMAFVEEAAALQAAVNVPVIVSNRINNPEDAHQIVQSGTAQMVGMARPFLADSQWVNKAMQNRAAAINPCIACNQACLDRVFAGKKVSCLVNPKAGSETLWPEQNAATAKKVLIIGAGPAGMAAAVEAASRGHQVRLVEKSERIGGQIWLAAQVPSKDEFNEILRYFDDQLSDLNVEVVLNREISDEDIQWADAAIVATGVVANQPQLPEAELPVYPYNQVLSGAVDAGKQVVLLGGGGIAVDVAQFLAGDYETIEHWRKRWGVDGHATGGLVPPEPISAKAQVHILIRSDARLGGRLGKTSAWVHRAELEQLGVKVYHQAQLSSAKDGVVYFEQEGQAQQIEADSIVLCTGQKAAAKPIEQLEAAGLAFSVVGGAEDPSRLDAARAIAQGTRAASRI